MGVVPVGDPLLPPPVLDGAIGLASAPIGADAAAPSCGDGAGDGDALVDAGGSGGGRRRLSWIWADSVAAGD